MNTREKVLKEALNCVNGEREKQYGNPEDNFKRIADRWSMYLTDLYKDTGVVIELEPIDVARMMIDFKLARANGPKDKLDNYVDIIGYAACAAEIFESEMEENKVAESRSCSKKAFDNIKDFFEQVAPGTVTNKEEFEKRCNYEEPNEKCNRNDCGQFDACMIAYQHYIYNKTKEASEAIDKCMKGLTNPYSYYHDKLANYVSVKAKEEHISLENLKDIDRKFPRELEELLDQASTDCVINGKRVIDCYKEIDELFKKFIPDKKKDSSVQKTYESIINYIISSSKKADVDQFDVVNHLTRNGHAPTEMAALLMGDISDFNDVTAYVDDAINEVKKDKK